MFPVHVQPKKSSWIDVSPEASDGRRCHGEPAGQCLAFCWLRTMVYRSKNPLNQWYPIIPLWLTSSGDSGFSLTWSAGPPETGVANDAFAGHHCAPTLLQDLPGRALERWFLKRRNIMNSSNISQHFWLVVWNMNFIFPYIGNNHPNWLSYVSEGLKPPTSQA
jgi:hypothetical protein